MTDTDFARHQGALPGAAVEAVATTVTTPRGKATAERGNWLIEVYWRGDEWHSYMAFGWGSKRVWSTTLGRCLRSLECAILREARTLAGMVGHGVAL